MGGGYSKREMVRFSMPIMELEGTEFFGNSPPSVFVGRFGYPKVNVGVLSPVVRDSEAAVYDNPRFWAKQNFKAKEILDLRDNLLNSRFKASVRGFNERLLDVSQEVGMAYKPVDIEVDLKKKPSNKARLSNIYTPLPRNAPVRNIKITENPKVKRSVEGAVSDIDLKAVDAVDRLYTKGIDENVLSKILSIGLLGIKKNRRLVPTRWSITATDDILGKKKLDEVRYFDEIEHQAYFGGFLGNFYLVLCFSDVWGFELFEMEVPVRPNPWSKTGKFYATDYESFDGRKKYAEECAGGYYAARLPVVERLYHDKKQGAVLVLRFVTEEDEYPLGVWVCREAIRKALVNSLGYFSDSNDMIDSCRKFIMERFNFDIDRILRNSKLLKRIQTQKRLTRWF